ncbi:MAG: hypothetical protein LBG08_05970 [Spirochaetaceae bacterium]|jgi:hypothetical protein|nr:hypothetical protein [Spirochaetaceae bacterium]
MNLIYQGDNTVNIITPEGVYAVNRGFSAEARVSGMVNGITQENYAPGETAHIGEFVRGLTDEERKFFKAAGVIEAFDRIIAERKRKEEDEKRKKIEEGRAVEKKARMLYPICSK